MGNTLRIVTALTVALLTVALAVEARAATADASIEDLISRGEAQLAEQDIDAAIATFSEAVATHPDSALAHTRLGGAYLLDRQYTEAIDQFQQAISLDANNAGAFIGLGMAYLHGGQTGPAKAALTEAKRLAPAKTDELDDLIQRIERVGQQTNPHR